jgi:hypothetical protein
MAAVPVHFNVFGEAGHFVRMSQPSRDLPHHILLTFNFNAQVDIAKFFSHVELRSTMGACQSARALFTQHEGLHAVVAELLVIRGFRQPFLGSIFVVHRMFIRGWR